MSESQNEKWRRKAELGRRLSLSIFCRIGINKEPVYEITIINTRPSFAPLKPIIQIDLAYNDLTILSRSPDNGARGIVRSVCGWESHVLVQEVSGLSFWKATAATLVYGDIFQPLLFQERLTEAFRQCWATFASTQRTVVLCY